MIELPSLQSVIKRFGLAPKRNLGQNFILEQSVTDRIVQAAGLRAGDDVLEVGPGPGGLTRSILFKNPHRLLVIEQDERCIAALEELGQRFPQLEIINADALTIGQLDLNKPKIIANLPYNIGTALLLKWLEHAQSYDSMTLMFQKEVALRIAATPGCKSYGRLSVIAQLLCNVELHFELAPDVFFPPPKVTSAVISLYPKAIVPARNIIENVEFITKILFNQRRKMLRSTLKALHPNIEALIVDTGVSLSQRPEELTIAQFVKLAENYTELKNNICLPV